MATNAVRDLRLDGHARVHVGNNINLYQNEDRCLADLRSTDPRLDKKRIENTKGGLLEDSYKWILTHPDFRRWRDNDQSRLLWIKGDAGKGKTMLLCGIINELESTAGPCPLSYFFCQSTDSRLNNATAVLRGLIYLLLTQQESLIPHLQVKHKRAGKPLFEDVNAFFALSEIFQDLLQDPMLTPGYLVVDALDECDEELPQLLEIIRETASATSMRFKWIVASRNRPDIQQQFTQDGSPIRFSLEVNANHVSQAIDVYIDHKVSQLPLIKHESALQDQVRDQMRQKADGTFLWVALVVQELRKAMLSRDVLCLLEGMPRGLMPLYDRMMSQVSQDHLAESCRSVLSTATLAYRPLHLLELRILAGLDEVSQSDMETLINLCGSFLTIREDYVYLIHQSAKDYLTANASTKIFPSGRQPIHYDLYSRSLKALSQTLRKDIYNLGYPGSLIANIQPPNPDPLASVKYSCVFWVDHMCAAYDYLSTERNESLDEGSISQFLKRHFLHWLESLSLSYKLSDGIISIRKLLHTLQPTSSINAQSERTLSIRKFLRSLKASTPNTSFQLTDFLKDALKFSLSFGSIIEQAPLQTYAALTFCPKSSKIKKQYWEERLPFIRNVVDTKESWDPCLQTLKDHSDYVRAVAFSLDGRTLASASDDQTVRLWDAATGREKQALKGHSRSVRAVAFSPDGRTLASASDDQTVRLWDAATGREKQALKGHSNSVKAVAFSPDGRTLASASEDRTVRLWDAATGREKQAIEVDQPLKSIAFSDDNQWLKTDRGLLSLSSEVTTSRVRQESSPGSVLVNKDWVSLDGQNVLWLPLDYAAICSAFYDNLLVLGHASGQITFFKFESQEGYRLLC